MRISCGRFHSRFVACRRRNGIRLMRLRAWFLAPTRLILALLFAAPLAIVCIYSLLTRGAYGGMQLPITVENYARLFDSLYFMILARSFMMAAAATTICLLLAFPLALFIARAQRFRN